MSYKISQFQSIQHCSQVGGFICVGASGGSGASWYLLKRADFTHFFPSLHLIRSSWQPEISSNRRIQNHGNWQTLQISFTLTYPRTCREPIVLYLADIAAQAGLQERKTCFQSTKEDTVTNSWKRGVQIGLPNV